ncbi:hypothetical protein ACC685_38740, partial [Rhizobium ruizarguesonis]
DLEFDIRATQYMMNLSFSQMQLVEIAKALSHDAEVVKKSLGGAVHRPEINTAETCRGIPAEIDVFRHRHVRNRAQFLLD